ncbi:grainyhead-like protein 2 homolog isoform X2 [Dysidea avara]|uniref:grainyhead-like protein 2 homolog isoform X2 n=1 Tax=Dysidea avara TaxID=196820 RepID=UPI0033346077
MERDTRRDKSSSLAGTFSPGKRSREAVSQIKPLSDEYLLHPGAASDPLPDIENEDKNPPPPLIMPSPPDTNSNSTSSFLNLLYELYGVQLQNAEVAGNAAKELSESEVKALQLSLDPGQKGGKLPGNKESDSKFQLGETGRPTPLFEVQEKYVYKLGAPTSVIQLQSEDTLTYLNKGQLYTLIMEGSGDGSVKSMIYLVFRSEQETERLLWQYWYNMQANPNQRAFDIDRKNCENAENIEDLGHNAFSVQWSPTKGPTKLVFCVNCLSTDFSAQKGVAGIPLHFLVDTYEDLDPSAEPIHRSVCKIKVFRDKGAERKIKDELRSVERRLQKLNSKGGSPSGSNDFQPPSKVTTLTPTSTLGTFPFIFIPAPNDGSSSSVGSSKLATASLLQNIRERETKRGLSTSLLQAKDEFDNLDVNPPKKKAAMSHKREAVGRTALVTHEAML